MMLEDAPTPEDNLLDVNGVKVYVDGQSIPLLKGSEIDYVDTLMGAGFTVNNPNAVAAGGCGSRCQPPDQLGPARGSARPRARADRRAHRGPAARNDPRPPYPRGPSRFPGPVTGLGRRPRGAPRM